MVTDRIFNTDCLKGLKSIPDNSVDLVATDVPYLCTSRGGGGGNMSGYWVTDKARSGKIFEYNNIDISVYLPELYRVLKENTHCYIMCNNLNLPHFMTEISKSKFHFTKCLIWDKVNKICGRYYMSQFEYVIMLRKGGDRPVNNCSLSDILRFRNAKTKDADGANIHDSEKPVDLFRMLISQSTNKGDLVLDPFMGSGTTAVASLREARHFIGFEIDRKYYEVACDRVKSEMTERTLF